MTRIDPKSFYDETMPGKLGPDYEVARWKTEPLRAAQYDMHASALRSVVSAVRGAERILEVGPGPGTWTRMLLTGNPTANYVLVDISHEMLGQARAALSGQSNVSFVESDFLGYTTNQPFDFFFSSRAIEYMPDKQAVARKIASLLRAGGKGAVVTKMPKPFFDRLLGRGVSALHQGQVGPRTFSRALTEAGLKVEGVRIATATVPGIHSPQANRFVFSLLHSMPLLPFLFPFAESYLVTFQKP